MHIVYAATTCSDAVYRQLFSHTKTKPAFQSQKYHRLLVEGLAAHTRVDVVANPPVNRRTLSADVAVLPAEDDGKLHYHYINGYRHPLRKALHVFCGTFLRTWKLADRDAVVIVDCLSRTAALAAQLAARLRRRQCIGVITDLPDMLHDNRLARLSANLCIRLCTGYVLLTEAMNGYIHNGNKPYVVLEGHADIAMEQKVPSLEKKNRKRVCLYAGSLSRRYGLGDLVEGFLAADLPETELHIYGTGDFEPELREIAGKDSRVVYGGMLLSGEVVEKEMEATLLVNPRPTGEEYVKYSFPSKTMEYMSTGTPVLMTRLPGVPEEYLEHLFLIREESAAGIARALTEALSHSDAALFEKGCRARRFVLEERNNVVQAAKIIEMLNQSERRR